MFHLLLACEAPESADKATPSPAADSTTDATTTATTSPSTWSGVACPAEPVHALDDPYKDLSQLPDFLTYVPEANSWGQCPVITREGEVTNAETGCHDSSDYEWGGRARWTGSTQAYVFESEGFGRVDGPYEPLKTGGYSGTWDGAEWALTGEAYEEVDTHEETTICLSDFSFSHGAVAGAPAGSYLQVWRYDLFEAQDDHGENGRFHGEGWLFYDSYCGIYPSEASFVLSGAREVSIEIAYCSGALDWTASDGTSGRVSFGD